MIDVLYISGFAFMMIGMAIHRVRWFQSIGNLFLLVAMIADAVKNPTPLQIVLIIIMALLLVVNIWINRKEGRDGNGDETRKGKT